MTNLYIQYIVANNIYSDIVKTKYADSLLAVFHILRSSKNTDAYHYGYISEFYLRLMQSNTL